MKFHRLEEKVPGVLEIYAIVFQALGAVCLFLLLKGRVVPGFIYLAAGYLSFLASTCLNFCACGRLDWKYSASGFAFLLGAMLLTAAARKLARTEAGESEDKRC